MNETKSIKIMRECPRFERCSVPVCPLDLLRDKRDALRDDSKCHLPKSRRHRIGKGTDLEHQGLTKREWAAVKRWEALSEDQKQRRKANLRAGSRIYTGLSDNRLLGNGKDRGKIKCP